VNKKGVYNYADRLRREKLNGLNEVEMLLKYLRDDNDVICYLTAECITNTVKDRDGRFLKGVFWAYRTSLEQFHIASDILIIDATYKTNRFKMPLVAICAVDRFGKSYLVGLALIVQETIPYYTWVIHQLRTAMIQVCAGGSVDTFLTDREIALIEAIKAVFPNSHHQVSC